MSQNICGEFDNFVPIPNWLNKSMIEKALKRYRKDESIEVDSIEIKPATAKGENYASLMFRCRATYTTGDQNEIKKSMCFIVKTSYGEDSYGLNLLLKFNVYEKELEMYEVILPKIRTLLKNGKSKSDIFATTFYVSFKKRAIFFEDLSLKGYIMPARCNGLDILHTKIVLNKLAKFHAGCSALQAQQPNIFKNFKNGMISREVSFENFYLTSLDAMINLISTWDSNNYAYYVEKLKKLKENLMEYAQKAFEVKSHHFNTLIHGDIWTNNTMFTYHQNNEPDKLMLVDFQFCCWTSATIDLHYFLNTSLSDDLRLYHQEELLLYYYRCLVRTLKNLNFPGYIPSLKQFHMEFIENSIYAFISALLVQPVMINENTENADIEAIHSNNERSLYYKKQLYENEKVQNNIRTLLPYFDRKGILD